MQEKPWAHHAQAASSKIRQNVSEIFYLGQSNVQLVWVHAGIVFILEACDMQGSVLISFIF